MRAEYDMTIVLTTHYLDEADSMAERVVIIDHGKIIADNTASALRAQLAGDRLAVVAEGNVRRVASLAADLPGARDVTVSGASVEVRVTDEPAALPHLVSAAQAAGIRIVSAQVQRPTLDDVFLNLTGRTLREDSTQSTRRDAA